MLWIVDARSSFRCWLIAGLGMIALPSRGVAQPAPPPNLGRLSIEDLMSVEVTSASRKEQRTMDVAAAVFVITHEDIQRSGLATVPGLLRLVPGLQVATINSNRWAVSIRGFSGLYANKLLVLVDGRSIYNRMFSGVLWDAQDLMLEDVERIEVIRGPGAAQWGANAVNGVINIVTRNSAETRGLLVRAEAGTADQHASVRYGGSVGALDYRFFARLTDRGPSRWPGGSRANDPSQAFATGFRADRRAGNSVFMFEGAAAAGRLRSLWVDLSARSHGAVSDVESTTNGAHVLGRWTLSRETGASLQLQSFVDIENRDEPVGDYSRRVFDLDSQYRMAIGKRQDIVAGGGYRLAVESLGPSLAISLVPEEGRVSLLSVFAQDEISFLDKRLSVTLGAQAQHDSDAGFAVQPTARVMWKPRPNQRVWAATSRAVRTPSLADAGIRLTYPPIATASGLPLVVRVVGNPKIKSEVIQDVEAGYRREWGSKASIDVAAFNGWYDGLVTTEVTPPVLEFAPAPQLAVRSTFGNGLAATTRGVEISGHWMPARAWRFDANYSFFHITPALDAASTDPNAAFDDANTPGRKWQLMAAFSPSGRVMFYAAIDHVGPLRSLGVDAYTRADATVRVTLTPRLMLMAIGQNLLHALHAEHFGTASLVSSTEVSRSLSVRLRWAVR